MNKIMPKQLQRLLILFLIFVAIFLVVRHFLVPESFGKLGHYRADALKDIQALDTKYIDIKQCAECHPEIDSSKKVSHHRNINCQTCHGPGNKHIQDPSANPMEKNTERKFCAKCHSLNAARKNIKQQDISKHNTEGKCVECHNPHQV